MVVPNTLQKFHLLRGQVVVLPNTLQNHDSQHGGVVPITLQNHDFLRSEVVVVPKTLLETNAIIDQ